MHSKQISLTWSLALAFAIVLTIAVSQSAQAQTYKVLYNFTGGHDGASPEADLTIDHGGNLYGTTNGGGVGYGAVFKLARKNSNWIFNTLYSLAGGIDGAGTYSGVVFGPDGSLYGATFGSDGGFGTVFKLQPPVTACKSALCPWVENETAGDHFTPREVIRLMVNLLFTPDQQMLRTKGIVKTLYDPACGTGGMLSVARSTCASSIPTRGWKCSGRTTTTKPSPSAVPT